MQLLAQDTAFHAFQPALAGEGDGRAAAREGRGQGGRGRRPGERRQGKRERRALREGEDVRTRGKGSGGEKEEKIQGTNGRSGKRKRGRTSQSLEGQAGAAAAGLYFPPSMLRHPRMNRVRTVSSLHFFRLFSLWIYRLRQDQMLYKSQPSAQISRWS